MLPAAVLFLLSACATALIVCVSPALAVMRLVAPRLPAPARAIARTVLLVAAYIATFECGALLAAARLRARGPFEQPALGDPVQTPSEQHLQRLTGRFVQRGFPLAGLRVHCDSPPPIIPSDRPILLISRHAGFLNAQLLTCEITNTLGRRTMAITKGSVQAAPGFGALSRSSCISSYRWTIQGRACALRRMITLARAATPADALVLFPEGTNATAARRQAALEAEERTDRAARFRQLQHVLAPQSGGVRAVLRAAPTADVLFYAHTGLEDLLAPVVDIGYPPLADGVLRTAWWHVPAEEIPRDKDKFESWLDDWWQNLDTWVDKTRAEAR